MLKYKMTLTNTGAMTQLDILQDNHGYIITEDGTQWRNLVNRDDVRGLYPDEKVELEKQMKIWKHAVRAKSQLHRIVKAGKLNLLARVIHRRRYPEYEWDEDI